MKKITQKIRKIKKFVSDGSYHLRHKRQAFCILKDIESVKGRTDSKLIKLADNYAKEIFGSKKFSEATQGPCFSNLGWE